MRIQVQKMEMKSKMKNQKRKHVVADFPKYIYYRLKIYNFLVIRLIFFIYYKDLLRMDGNTKLVRMHQQAKLLPLNLIA